MNNGVETEVVQIRADIIKKLTFDLPKHYPAVKSIEKVDINLRKMESYLLLDLVVFDITIEVEVVYIGNDNERYFLKEEFSLLHKEKKPHRNTLKVQEIGTKMQKDYQIKMADKKDRVREFDVIILAKLFNFLGYTYVRKDKKTNFYQGYKDNLSKRSKKYPWKRYGVY